MASNYNITMKQYNGVDYDILYPETTPEQISGNFNASRVDAGTFNGEVIANESGQTPDTSLLRNSRLVSTETDPTINGEICWTYS